MESSCSFNPTFAGASNNGWISKGYYGLDQGPIILMIENYRSGLSGSALAIAFSNTSCVGGFRYSKTVAAILRGRIRKMI